MSVRSFVSIHQIGDYLGSLFLGTFAWKCEIADSLPRYFCMEMWDCGLSSSVLLHRERYHEKCGVWNDGAVLRLGCVVMYYDAL